MVRGLNQLAEYSGSLDVFLAGASGTIGRATAQALVDAGHRVICFVRSGADVSSLPPQADIRIGQLSDPSSIAQQGFRDDRFDAVISCVASRTGVPNDAWAIDHKANMVLLEQARASHVDRFIMLSAICVQKPRLAFQHAKLTFEAALMESDLDWTIVRPTAFFKSLSGQVARVMAGKPYLVFGDGKVTSCKPISDRDLGRYLAQCLVDPETSKRVLPIGGPGPAITPLDQAHHLFQLLGQSPRIRHVPLALMDVITGALGTGAVLLPGLTTKAELARIGRYYATESMLLLDPETGNYSSEATPSFGEDTLFDYYATLVRGDAAAERGAHAVFGTT
ncbi:MAG: NAD(P)H-binding protein [Pseudomonadota bacterium]